MRPNVMKYLKCTLDSYTCKRWASWPKGSAYVGQVSCQDPKTPGRYPKWLKWQDLRSHHRAVTQLRRSKRNPHALGFQDIWRGQLVRRKKLNEHPNRQGSHCWTISKVSFCSTSPGKKYIGRPVGGHFSKTTGNFTKCFGPTWSRVSHHGNVVTHVTEILGKCDACALNN